MCGIIGCIGRGDTVAALMDGLSTLEYRGYDSAGVALAGDGLDVVKRAGELARLQAAIADRQRPPMGTVGVGHTRWSTHGSPTDANAHPHTNADGSVAVVHNGIIENYSSLRAELEAVGVSFTSETDTEVVPHLIARHLADGVTPEDAFRRTLERLEGSYSLATVIEGTGRLFAARQDSPLVLGVGAEAYYVASDVPAFISRTRNVVYLADGDVAVLTQNGWDVTDRAGSPVDRPIETIEWSAEQTGKSGYDHYMIKEIHEQPTALRQCLSGRVDELHGRIDVDNFGTLSPPNTVHLVACGTSYNASLYGAELLRSAGIQANAYAGSEYAVSPAPVTDDTLVVGVTQSGETADTLSALRQARDRSARTLALTNVVGSTAARECDHVMYIRAGPEISVAATKTFSSQLTAMNLFFEQLVPSGYRGDHRRALIGSLRQLPSSVQEILDESNAREIVEVYESETSFFFVGRGLNVPVALEGALKFTEVTYAHAEGFAAGELKHGPLALVTERTPVFAIVTGDDERAQKTIGNVKEIEARGAPVIAVTDGVSDVGRYADHVLTIPESSARTAPILANVQLQLVAYHMADLLGRPVDKPRNLAKSVTVE